MFAYVGSFTTPERGGLGHGGISVFSRGADGWKEVQTVERKNPSFLAFDRDRRHLYAVQGNGPFVAAYSVDAESGKAVLLGEKHVGLYNGVSAAVDPSGKFLLVACLNNGSGAILSLRIETDGSLGEICDIEVPQGAHGPLDSQRATQPHQVVFDPAGKYLIVCDKGLDCVHSYTIDSETGLLREKCTSQFPTSCCPRHVAFRPDGKVAYVLAEWMGGVFPCRYEDGRLTPLEWHKTAPLEYTGFRNIGAEIAVHPSGKFVYASNRGYSSIVCFAAAENGRLRPLEWTTDRVAKPRFFTISEDGGMLYCANEETHCVSVYSIDTGSGHLSCLGETMRSSAPGCVLFV